MRFSFAVFWQKPSQFAAEQDAAQIGLDRTLRAVHPPYQLSHHVPTTNIRKAESDQNPYAPGKPLRTKSAGARYSSVWRGCSFWGEYGAEGGFLQHTQVRRLHRPCKN